MGVAAAVVTAACACAAPPAIDAAETTVRLGVSAGFTGLSGGPLRYATSGGYGLDASIGALVPNRILSWGASDIYVGVADAAVAGTAGGASPSSNTAIVRLGLGWPVSGAAELIPYVAGGYQGLSYRGQPGGMAWHQGAGLLGGGLKIDVTPGPLWVVSARAEGFAVLGGTARVASQDFDMALGSGAEERVSLDADYRLRGAWHAFAGFGITHYASTGAGPGGLGSGASDLLEVNSFFGLAYGF
jgi:hypothetical protein